MDRQQEIEQRMKKEKDRRMFERYQAVHLYMQGKTRKEVAAIIGRDAKTVSKYIRAYQDGGIDGLQMNYSPGAPRRLTSEQEEQFRRAVIEQLPHETGFPSKFNWTLHLMGEYIKREFQVSYSLQGVADLANRLNLSYTKPTYTLNAADPIKQQTFREVTFPELKKTRNRGNRPPSI